MIKWHDLTLKKLWFLNMISSGKKEEVTDNDLRSWFHPIIWE